jgi:phosphohistidine phosphatase
MFNEFSKTVILVRHAKAVSTREDPSRPLSINGRQQAERMASWLAELSPEIDEIRHSGKRRAEQTASVFARRLKVGAARVREVSGMAPNDSVDRVADELDSKELSLMLVGHVPFLGRLASRLLVGEADRLDVRFADAGVVVLSRAAGGWQLVAVLSHEML